MARIVVVGGNGFLGSRAVRALSRARDVEVVVAGRRGPLLVDLSRPETFAALEGADVVVDASSSHAVAPDALARACLERGIVLLEASSDRLVVERLLDAHRADRTARGALVLGAGIFTGVSNAMAAEAARALGDSPAAAESIEIGVASSPFSGAGAGTIDLMADAIAIPTRTIRGGARVDDPPIAPGPELPFPGGARRTLHASFAEPVMVHASTRVPEVAMYMAPRPSWLRLAFLALPSFVVQSRAFGALLRVYFRVLRAGLLRSIPSRVELVVRARRGRDQAIVGLDVADGMEAGGVAIAATALVLAREKPKGTHLVDEVVPFERMIAEMRALSPELGLAISRSSGRSGSG